MSLDGTPLENIVAFPGPGRKITVEVHEDPLEDLLHEFDHIEDCEEWQELEREDDIGETTVEMVLKELFTEEQSMAQMACRLQEVQKRTEYFMNEIETFLPKSKS